MSNLFNTRDRKLIKQIPLSVRPIRDMWQWTEELKGTYTVKSGHRLLSLPPMEPPDAEEQNGWKKIHGVYPSPQRFKTLYGGHVWT